MSRPGRLAAVAAALSLGGCGGGGGAAPIAAPPGSVALRGCYMTVHAFGVDRARLRAAVPARFTLGTFAGDTNGTLAFWVLSCDRAGARPAVLSLVGAQVRSPVDPSAPQSPARFDHYLLEAQSNDPQLVSALRAAGFPAQLVPGISFSHGATTRVQVPAPSGAYALQVRGAGYEGRHNHDNNWWLGASGTGSRMEIRMFQATDRGCASCPDASVTAAAGSEIARLLGATTKTSPVVAFDHYLIPAGSIALSTRVPLTFPASRPQGFLGVVGEPAAGGGVRVSAVVPASPAASAGIRVGDVVLAVDGHPVHDLAGLSNVVRALPPGTTVTVTLRRGPVQITLSRAPM